MAKVLLLGAGGQLGRELREVFGRTHDVTALNRDECDLREADAVRAAVVGARARYVLNAGAHTKVDLCEQEPQEAFRLNGEAVATLAAAVRETGGQLVHFSTDYVFDGTTTRPHAEEEPTNPQSVYGRSKLAGEAAALALGAQALVVRTQWLYGPGERNFVYAIASRAARGEPLQVVNDQHGSPTHTLDVAQAVLALVEQGHSGLFHATNAGVATWFDFAAAILELGGFRTTLTPSATDLSKYPAPRPAYSVLSTEKLRRTTGVQMRPWREALAAYLARVPWGSAPHSADLKATNG